MNLINNINSTEQNKYLPADEVMNFLWEIEEKYQLLEHKIDGWCAWPILRYPIWYRLNNPPVKRAKTIKLRNKAYLALRDLFSLWKLHKHSFIVKTYTSALGEEVDEKYKDVYFDDLLLQIKDLYKIEAINNFDMIQRSNKALIKTDIYTFLFELIAGLLSKIQIGPKYIFQIANEFSGIINKEFGYQDYTNKFIASRLLNFYWGKKLYAFLFNAIKPKYILVADPGEIITFAAAKENNITPIELQHGIIDRYHFAYSWTDKSLKYKSTMAIPSKLFLFGEYTKNELDSLKFWGESLKAVGSLRMDQYRKNKPQKNKTQCTLCFTSQGIDRQLVIDFLIEFMKISQDKLNPLLYIKLHPVYESGLEPYSEVFMDYKNVKIIRADSLPSTYELICMSHFHLSVSSTTHYESLALGTPTVILPYATSELVMPLYNRGHAALSKEPSDLLDLALRWETYNLSQDISEYYFKSNALENMKRELGLS